MSSNKQKLLDKKHIEETKREIDELIHDDQFFDWLNDITETMPILTTINDLDISNSDYNNLKKIRTLNNIISEYANCKKIYPIFFEKTRGYFYFIINKNVPYEIGIGLLNNNLICFCSRCNLNNNSNFIDLDNIKKDYFKKQQKLMENNKEDLKKLKVLLIKLMNNGIDYKDILSHMEKAHEQYQKKLKKD